MTKTEPSLLAQDEVKELAPIVRIRTETVLSQYPLHRLAKKTSLEIRVTKANGRGKVITTWEVSPSRKYGEPGPLAYKLDTILVNRAIDEARPHIPEIIKLGSLREICEALNISPEGKNTQLVKNAFHQNASAYITAKLDYKSLDGSERTFEFGASRYEVIFLGQKLPNGQKADAVYIILHRTFREFLAHAKARPLDYEYLKALPPAAQRLYELISFQIFAALKNDNPRARYLYSDFCKYAPLTRYGKWEQVKKQLYKVHRPHKESGYLSKVEFEEITDEEGRPDWVMWYTPGRKARREFKEFTTRKGETAPVPPRLVSKAPRQEIQLSTKQESLLASLLAYKVEEDTARELVDKFPAERIEQELEAFPHRKLDGVENPTGLLISAIKSGKYSQPPKVEKKRAEKKAQEAKQRREEHEAQYRLSYVNEHLRPKIEALETANPEAFAELQRELLMWDEYKHRPDYEGLRLYTFEKFAEENPGLRILNFWQWDEKKNPQAFKLAE
jgi:hypothetical protein